MSTTTFSEYLLDHLVQIGIEVSQTRSSVFRSPRDPNQPSVFGVLVILVCVRPNLVGAVVSATPLETPLDLTIPENDAAAEAIVLDEIAKWVFAAQERVAVIVDGCALRYGVTDEVKHFLQKNKVPRCCPHG